MTVFSSLDWTPWEQWTNCSVKCEFPGARNRTRECRSAHDDVVQAENDCQSQHPNEYLNVEEVCNDGPCMEGRFYLNQL